MAPDPGPHPDPEAASGGSALSRALRDVVGDDELDVAVLALRAMRFGRLVERHLQHVLRPSGLERSDLSVLASLLLAPAERGQSPTELARTVVQTTSGMTKTINRLASRDLVRRDEDLADARGVVVTLTPGGRTTAAGLLEALIAELAAVLPDASRRQDLSVALASVLPAFEASARVTRT